MSNNNAVPQTRRTNSEMSHEYLVECVQLLERYTATMLQMILDHHPYMGPAASTIGEAFQKEHAEIEARHPKSQLVVAPASFLKPH